ncbi:MAG: hypothetical protein IPK08_13790 [Bacteroidetes bacterium]|nr:hypothetical protein [Bacteroidota bacterium]
MKRIITIFLFLKIGLASGQPVNLYTFPEIVNQGPTITSFVPDGWTIADSATGDLNGDNDMDMAFVLKSNDSLITFTRLEKQGEVFVEVNRTEKYPRSILLIVFRTPHTNNFSLIEQSNSIIIGQKTKIEIDSSFLKIEYSSNDSVLNYSSNSIYYFHFQNEQFLLTKVDRFTLNGIWTEELFMDFTKQKMRLSKAKINGGKADTVWKDLDNIQPKTMKIFERPFIWYIIDGIMI